MVNNKIIIVKANSKTTEIIVGMTETFPLIISFELQYKGISFDRPLSDPAA